MDSGVCTVIFHFSVAYYHHVIGHVILQELSRARVIICVCARAVWCVARELVSLHASYFTILKVRSHPVLCLQALDRQSECALISSLYMYME